MTALPNVTGTDRASRTELLIPVSLMSICFVLLPSGNIPGIRMLTLAAISSLLIFGLRRLKSMRSLKTRKQLTPPPALLFVVAGLVGGIIGILLALAGDYWSQPTLTITGRALYLRIMMVAIVMGVGSVVIPFFTGITPELIPQEKNPTRTLATTGGLIILFIVGSFVELTWHPTLGRSMQAISVIVVGFLKWRIHRMPPRRTPAAKMLWLSCWMFVLGILGSALLMDHALHLTHLTYVGGISMMVLSVATRVILSHGAHDVLKDEGSKLYYGIIFLVVIAAVTRASIGFTPDLYMSHLAYSALLLVSALLIWGWVHFRKMITRGH